MFHRSTSALCLALLTALPCATRAEVIRHDVLTNWSLFEDEGYCWIATNSPGLTGGRRLLLTLDLAGSAALFVDFGGGVTFEDAATHLLRIDGEEIAFRSQGDWAWSEEEDTVQALQDAILSADRIGYVVTLRDGGAPVVRTGEWLTAEGRQAFDTLRETCGR